MTVDEKITRLQESAMQEARSKGNAIVEQHKKALTHVFEQHKAEALIQADTRIKAEKTSVKQQLGMANSKAALELKRELGAAQKTGFTLSISKEDFIGGIRAVIPERNILVDYAFKGALEREYQKFAFGGGMGSGR